MQARKDAWRAVFECTRDMQGGTLLLRARDSRENNRVGEEKKRRKKERKREERRVGADGTVQSERSSLALLLASGPELLCGTMAIQPIQAKTASRGWYRKFQGSLWRFRRSGRVQDLPETSGIFRIVKWLYQPKSTHVYVTSLAEASRTVHRGIFADCGLLSHMKHRKAKISK